MNAVAWGALGLFLVSCVMGFFFSGTETGFFRATRLRLAMDAHTGNWVSRLLFWMANRPSLYVATGLVGNNLANYIESLAVVTFTRQWSQGNSYGLEIALTILTTPLLFIFNDLLPKSLFYEAPNRLLRRSGPWFVAASILFCVPVAFLWAMGKMLEWLGGESPQQTKLALARRELQQILEEGHIAGVLMPAQRSLATGLLAIAVQPVSRLATPAGRLLRVRMGATNGEILRLARRHQQPEVLIEEPLGGRRLVGYVRVADICLADEDAPAPVRELMQIPHGEAHIAALMRMQAAKQPLARVVDDRGQTLGIITRAQLTAPVLRGG